MVGERNRMPLYKLVVLGDGGVGKTAIVHQLVLNLFVETYDPTIEDSYRKQVVIDGQSCILEVLDTAGQEEYTALRDQWIGDGEGFVLVYDISSRSTFTRVQKFHHQIQRVKESSKPGPSYPGSPLSAAAPLGPVPVMLVGNKSDRVTEREVSILEGRALARELGCEFVEGSARDCVNVEKVFYDVVRLLRRQRQLLSQQQTSQAGSPNSPPRTPQQTTEQRDFQNPYLVKRTLWRKKISIPPNERDTEAGRMKLTRCLITAARANKEQEVEAFLSAGAYPDGQPGVDGAAIHCASALGHINIVNLLLKRGAGIDARGPSGTTPLQVAAAEGHSAVVKLLLHKRAQIDQTSQLHGTSLCAAASRGRLNVVRILLKKGANVNAAGGPYGNALQAAAWVGKVAVIEALLNSGAEINARGEGDCTALQIASFAGNAEAVWTLLVRGAHVNAEGGKYGCALKAANDHGHFGAVTLLLEFGASAVVLRAPPEHLDAETKRKSVVDSESATNVVDGPIRELQQQPDEALKSPNPIPDVLGTQLPDPVRRRGMTLGGISNNSMSLESWTGTLDVQNEYKPAQPLKRPHITALGFSTINDPPNANIDIVFVHGLQGHPEQTWTYTPQSKKRRSLLSPFNDLITKDSQETVFWPFDLLSSHPNLAQARLLTWGYNTQVVADFFGASDQQNISQHGHNLMVALQQERKNDSSRPLIFVAHSLGGILVKVALDNSKRSSHQPQYLPIYTSTKGIIFIGTPHRGSTSASWGLLASNLTKFALQSPSLKVLKRLKPNDELLENLQRVFLQILEDNMFKIHSFYETQPMLGVYGLRDRVVPYDSAQVGHARHEIVHEINGNHSEICKFRGTMDAGYKAVFGAIEDYIKLATAREDIIPL